MSLSNKRQALAYIPPNASSYRLGSISSEIWQTLALRMCVWCVPVFCVFLYSNCVTGAKACDGDPNLDPENNCLPFFDGSGGGGPGNSGLSPLISGRFTCDVQGSGSAEDPIQVVTGAFYFKLAACPNCQSIIATIIC